jgi:hypothetical protein
VQMVAWAVAGLEGTEEVAWGAMELVVMEEVGTAAMAVGERVE